MSDTTGEATAEGTEPVEVVPADAPDTAPGRWSRPLEMVRGAMLVGALLLAWGMLIYGGRGQGEDYDPLFHAGHVAMFVALGVVTVVALASLRYARLRRALLPFEVGLLVTVAIIFAGVRGVEVDTNEDVAFIAVLCGIGAALVVAFLNTLLDGYRSRGIWIAGVATVAALIGMSLPVFADGLTGSDGWSTGNDDPYLSSALLARVTLDGGVRLASQDEAPVGVVEAVPVPVSRSMEPSAPTSVAVAPPVGAVGGLQLVADARGNLRLEVERATLLPASAASGLLDLRRGSCAARSNTDVRIDSWRVRNAGRAPARMRVEGLRLDDLRFEDRIYAVFGSGAPLAPVTCVDVVDPTGVALAQAGLARTYAACIEPLVDETVVPAPLTADSFQDEACAERFQKLVDVTTGTFFATAETDAAAELARCLDRATVSSQVVRVDGGVVVTKVEQSSNPDVITQAGACFDAAAPRMLGSAGYGGMAMSVPAEAAASPAPVPAEQSTSSTDAGVDVPATLAPPAPAAAPGIPPVEEQDVSGSTATAPAG